MASVLRSTAGVGGLFGSRLDDIRRDLMLYPQAVAMALSRELPAITRLRDARRTRARPTVSGALTIVATPGEPRRIVREAVGFTYV